MNKIIGLVITAMVSVIVLAAVLIPTLNDATTTEDTFKNEGYFYLDEFTDDYTFFWDYDDPTTFTVNGEDVTFINNSGLDVRVVLGEKFMVTHTSAGLSCTFYGNGTYVIANATNKTLTLTLSGGTLTATNGNTTKTISDVSLLYSIVEKGDYVMKKSNSIAYLKDDSTIYATGHTYNGVNNIFWHLEGTPAANDGISWPDDYNSNFTVTNETVNIVENSDHIDLYDLTNLTFTVTNNNVEYNVTASYFVVPAEVTAERSVHLTDAMNVILNVIPLLIIVAVLLGVVAVFILRRE